MTYGNSKIFALPSKMFFCQFIFIDPKELQEEYVRNSNLDWTIIKPGAFTDGEKTENYQHGFGSKDKSLKLNISGADVADFILKQVDDQSYLHQSPGLSY